MSRGRIASWVQIGSLAVIVIALISILQLLPMDRLVAAMRTSIEALGIWGPIVFSAIYVAATVLLLPGAVITLAAGALFGPLLGTVTVSLASVTGASLAFLIARYFARKRVEEQLSGYPKFAAIDRAIGQDGWKIVGMLRLSPAIPFNVSNYLYGLTSIPFGQYVLTSWIAMAPATFMYVYLGYVAAAGIESAVGADEGSSQLAQWALRLVGLAATVGVTVYVTRIARRAIAEHTDIAAEASAPAPAAQTPPAAIAAPWPWRATALAMGAVLALGTAGYARSHRASVESYVEQLVRD